MPAPLFRPAARLAIPHKNLHFERDANFLWRLNGHWTQIVVNQSSTPHYVAATKADVTT